MFSLSKTKQPFCRKTFPLSRESREEKINEKKKVFPHRVINCARDYPCFFGSRTLFKGFTQISDSKEKQITRPSEKIEPFAIVDVKSDQKAIQFGKTFSQDGDWLKDLSISYKNNTHKTIVSFSISLFFPETIESGNLMAYSFTSETPLTAALKGERGELVHPGEIVPIAMDENEFRKMKTFIERRQPLNSLRKVELRVGFVLFDDGTAWDGEYVIPDPKNPRHFVPPPKGKEVIQ